MKLSIIIPVSKDFRLLRCITSIDVNTEIIVVFNNNPSQELIAHAAQDARVTAIEVPEPGCNLAHVFNIGIQRASHEYIIFTNSDCQFLPGQIQKCYDTLQFYPVVKGSVCFESCSFTTRLVANLRFLFHEVFSGEQKPLYGPGLAFHRSVKSSVGGYFFDRNMGWGEDGELSQRIYSAGIPVFFLPNYLLVHPPETIQHDLYIAYRIGYSEWIQHLRCRTTILKSLISDVLNLVCDRKRRFRIAFKYGGIMLVSYLVIWKMVAHMGYYIHAVTNWKGEKE